MTNEELVEIVRNHPDYKEYRSPAFDKVLEAMLRVDRKDFLPETVRVTVTVEYPTFENMANAYMFLMDNSKTDDDRKKAYIAMLTYMEELFKSGTVNVVKPRDSAYEDTPLPIGYGQKCSQPSIVAFMAYLLELEKGMKVFELGYGCGYSTAITYHLIISPRRLFGLSGHLIGSSGHLVAAEIIPELAKLGHDNLEAHLGTAGVERQLVSGGEAKLIPGNGLEVLEKEAPFDRIYLTAGVNLESFDPSKLARHLKPKGGILLFPEERGDLIKQMYKGGNLIDTKRYGDGKIAFVPLIGINS